MQKGEGRQERESKRDGKSKKMEKAVCMLRGETFLWTEKDFYSCYNSYKNVPETSSKETL